MAIYTTFFVHAPEGLDAAFPGWKRPLPEPVKRTYRNPFTGVKTELETREPEWDEDEDDACDAPQGPSVVAIEGDYAAYLESRLRPAVAAAPHWCSKGFTTLELDELHALLGFEGPATSPAMFCNPMLGHILVELSPQLDAALSRAPQSELWELSEKWAAAMSTPKHTHSGTGDRIVPDWTREDARARLEPIAGVAARAEPGQRTYLLIEP